MKEAFEIHKFPLWSELKDKRIPLSFDIEITARCNLNCRHCYINLPPGDAAAKNLELTPAEIESIARDAVQLGTVWCLISGGEPLLRKDFPEIYLRLKRLGLLVSVYTNATLVRPEHVALFKRYPPRDIEVTMYGASQATCAKVTGRRNALSAFHRGLRLLLDNGIPVRLKAMALRSNLHEFDQMSRFCIEHTKDFFRSDPILCLRVDRDPRRNAEILAERLSPEEVIAVDRASYRFDSLNPVGEDEVSHEPRDPNKHHLFLCGAGKDSFSVSYNGIFRLCSTLSHPDCTYNLRQGSLREAWQKLVPQVRDMTSDRPEYVESCWKCKLALKNLCRWCPAKAYLETGEMDRPVDFFCRIANTQGT